MLDKTKAASERNAGGGNGINSDMRGPRLMDKEGDAEHRLNQNSHNEHDLVESFPAAPGSDYHFDEGNFPGTFWLNDSGSPCFSNVDQLLSPGFFVSENVFQPFLPGYDNGSGMVDSYGQYNMSLPL
jgi:hypothetical protein